jgi:hypothetical protein
LLSGKTGATILSTGSSWIKMKNPAYTQIVGRQDLFHKNNAVGNPYLGGESKIGLIAPTFWEFSGCLHEERL